MMNGTKNLELLAFCCHYCAYTAADMAGGEREVGIMDSALRMALRVKGRQDVAVEECTIDRQCEDAFIDALAPHAEEYDAFISFACGAGVQALAERFPKLAVYPGLNTQFIGILESQGVWTEKRVGCGSCRLGEYAGICPLPAAPRASSTVPAADRGGAGFAVSIEESLDKILSKPLNAITDAVPMSVLCIDDSPSAASSPSRSG